MGRVARGPWLMTNMENLLLNVCHGQVMIYNQFICRSFIIIIYKSH